MDYFGLCIIYVTKGITSHHTIRTKPSELKSLLMKVKEESKKSWLKAQHSKNKDHGIWFHHFIANRWGEKWKQWQILFSWALKHGSDCSQEIKRCLLLGRRAMTNLCSILKSRDITLLTKVHIIKALVFPVVIYGYESWTIKKAECQRIDAFELWCWRRLLRTYLGLQGDQPNESQMKSTLNIHWKGWCWSWGSNTLANWCKELTTHWKRPWCWERLKAGGEGDDRG